MDNRTGKRMLHSRESRGGVISDGYEKKLRGVVRVDVLMQYKNERKRGETRERAGNVGRRSVYVNVEEKKKRRKLRKMIVRPISESRGEVENEEK